MTPIQVLNSIFKYDTFREGQEEIINSVIDYKNNNGVLAICPTSYGKSLTFQIPALVMEGLNIVVSPLIALMKDQVDTLEKKGVGVAFYNSSLTDSEKEGVLSFLQFGQINLLYVAPERFQDESFMSFIKQFGVNIFAVDEAHSISQFADFRPSYRHLKKAIEFLEPKQVVAVTATATPIVQDDICKQLGIPNAKRFIKGFYRDNLMIKVEECDLKARVDTVIKQVSVYQKAGHDTGIIYVGKRKDAEYMNDQFNNTYRIPSTFYHAGLSAKERDKIQNNWMEYGGNIVCSTAFALGIDKSNVRYVINASMASDLEEHYQLIGRAGRDGKLSICKTYLSFNYDYRLQRYFIDSTYPDVEVIFKFWKWINDKGKDYVDGVMEMTQADMAEYTDIDQMVVSSCINILKKSNLIKTLDKGKYQLVEWYHKPENAKIDYKEIQERKEYKLSKLKEYIQFLRNDKICRMKFIMTYFGINDFDKCGKCDICKKS